MPLVFVHGVANRIGDDYEAGKATRDALFRRYLLARHRRTDGQPVTILSPYWGGFGARPRWNLASLPHGEYEVLGGEDAPFVELGASAPAVEPEGHIGDVARVLWAARSSLPAAVDLLWEASALDVERQDDQKMAEDAAALARLAEPVRAYAEANPKPAWLAEVHTDQDFLTRLEQEVDAFTLAAAPLVPSLRTQEADSPAGEEEWETLGIGSAWQALRSGAARLGNAVVGRAGRTASDLIRPAIAPGLARFLGDVFVYLHQQDKVAGPIRACVADAIREGAALSTLEDPLVVVAHSMGGNIVYDLLSDELSGIQVPLLVTAGTQVSLFEELKLFRRSDPDVPADGTSQKVSRPSNIARWINVFDYADVLGFSLGGVIDGVEDHSYVTGTLVKAHGQYFLQPSFHERIAARVR